MQAEVILLRILLPFEEFLTHVKIGWEHLQVLIHNRPLVHSFFSSVAFGSGRSY